MNILQTVGLCDNL